MNYMQHLNQYRIARMQNPLSTNAIALYFILLEFNNSLGWIDTFTVANSVLMGLSDLAKDSFHRARNELKQKGYIGYENGSGNQAGKYLIVRFATQTAHKPNTSDTQSATQTKHTARPLTKEKKTKLNTISSSEDIEMDVFAPPPDTVEKKPQKKKHGIYGWVLLTEQQYQRLLKDYPDKAEYYINIVDELAQQTGNKNKWKDWNLTVRKAIRNQWGGTPPKSTKEDYKDYSGGENFADFFTEKG